MTRREKISQGLDRLLDAGPGSRCPRDESIGVAIGARVRAVRLTAGMTQGHFARLVRTARPNVARLERGTEHTPSLDLLARCAEALDVKLSWLVAAADR